MTSPRRAAQRRALTSITFTLLTISRLCLNCHTGWNLVLKGHNLPHCQPWKKLSVPSTSQDIVQRTLHDKTLQAANGDKCLNVCSSITAQNSTDCFTVTEQLEREQRIPATASGCEGSVSVLVYTAQKSKGSTESQYKSKSIRLQGLQLGSNN